MKPHDTTSTKAGPWKTIRVRQTEVAIYEGRAGFRACWYEGGARRQKFCTDATDIVSFAKRTAAALANGVATPHAEKELAYFAQLQAEMEGVPLHQAVEFWRQNQRFRVKDARLDALFAEWRASLDERQLSPSYCTAANFYCGPLAKAFPGFIRGVSAAEIEAWVNLRTKSLSSRRHYLRYAITLFRWARDARKALPKGDTEPELVPMPRPKAAAIQIYTPEEMKLFLRHAQGTEELALVVLGGFCGLRSSEITGDRTAHGPLQCEEILFDERSVRVTQKVQEESVVRYAPLLPNAARHLKRLRGKIGPVWDTTTTPFHVFGRLLARIRAAGHTVRRLRNGFRRSFISYRTAVTRDVPRVADECNTSPEKIRNNYRRPGLESVGHTWFKL